MAEINAAAAQPRHGGVRRSKKQSTRVDLTPMVDLGFLLITFFIVTTTWALPKALHLGMPAEGKPMPLPQSSALTLIPLGDDRVFYYFGDLESARKDGGFGVKGYQLNGGIGDLIRQKQAQMDQAHPGGRKELMMMIKPAKDCSYRNVIQLLDETQINLIGKYALIDMTPGEEQEVHELAMR